MIMYKQLEKSANWYAFHFGSQVATSSDFKPEQLFGNVRDNCYVMFADFCSFTSFFKATKDIRQVEPLISSFYTQIRKIIHRHNGVLDKIMGDGFIAVWNLYPEKGDQHEETLQSILKASKELSIISLEIANLWQEKIEPIIKPKGIRIGLTKGEILIIRRNEEYPGLSLIGNPINLASRLQSIAKENELICSEDVFNDYQLKIPTISFEEYINSCGEKQFHAKNYGFVKAWSLNLLNP
jgi:class 3 adenylate cyclase